MILLCMMNAVFYRLGLLSNSNSIMKNTEFQLNMNFSNRDQFFGPVSIKSPKQLDRK